MTDVKLHKPSVFRQRFVDKLPESSSQREAYQKVEREYRRTFGERKYTSFKSFINSYYRAKNK